MYIWDLQASLKGGTAADLMSKAQSAKLSSIWVKIGDGAVPYANTQGNNTQILLDVVARCQVANILVLGYHVPHCPTAAAVQTEVGVCSGAVDDFGLAGIVVDNEDGPGFFTGNADTAAAYGQALQTAMHTRNKISVMSSNDIISAHPKSFGSIIGRYIDVNGPQVYYGESPTVQNRLGRAVSENAGIAAPFFPVGAAFVSAPSAGDGGCANAQDCAQRAAQFIDLVSQMHQANPSKYPGYGFWDWQEAPDELWNVLTTTEVFTVAEVAAAAPQFAAQQAAAAVPLANILQTFDKRANGVAFEGISSPDRNLPGNLLLVVTESVFYSFQIADIVDQEQLGGGKVRLWVRRGARGWQASAIAANPPVAQAIAYAQIRPTPALPTPATPPTVATVPSWVTLGRSFDGLVWSTGPMPSEIVAWMNNIETVFPDMKAYVDSLKSAGVSRYWEWCGGFVQSMLSYATPPIRGPISAAGLQGQQTTDDWAYHDSWKTWGTKVWDLSDGDISNAQPQVGDVLVWDVPNVIHHVSFYDHPEQTTDTFASLGGDQGKPLRVCTDDIDMSYCVAIRRAPTQA
jgi:hypothetical protein